MKQLTIGNLAKQSGVGIETVRFYERKGLLPKPSRTRSGYREYIPEDARRIRFIKRAQDLGFTLKEIQELLTLGSGARPVCSDVQKKADAKVTEIDDKIRDLKQMKKKLKELSSACGQGVQELKTCKVMDCFEPGECC